MMQASLPWRAISGRGKVGNVTAQASMHVCRAFVRTDITKPPRQHRQASSLVSTSTGGRAAAGRSAARDELFRRTNKSTFASPCSSLAHAPRKMSVTPRLEKTWWHGGRRNCRGNPKLQLLSPPSSGSLTTLARSEFVRHTSSGRGERGVRSPIRATCRELKMPRRGMSSTTMSERDFHSVADEALEEIHDAVEEALEEGFPEDFDCNMSQGVLNIVVGDRGTWVLNKQSPNRQIWWSSPISGPMRFEYHEESNRWLNTRDGETELRVILATEMRDKCGVSV